MLDFTLTEEQRNIRDMAHDFAEHEIRPVAWARSGKGGAYLMGSSAHGPADP